MPKIHTSEHHHRSVIRHHFYLLEYKDIAVASLFHRAKFQGEYAILQDLITDCVPHIQALAAQYGPYDMVVPVASDMARSIRKGYSVASLGTPLLARCGVPIGALLAKTQSRAERNKQTREARMVLDPQNYVYTGQNNHALTRVLLFDDIITTGSTLQEHALALRAQYPDCVIDTLCISGG